MEEHGREPHKEPRKPRVISRGDTNDYGESGDASDDFNYFAFSAADRLSGVKDKIEEREKILFELSLVAECLDGNPELGEHREGTIGASNTPVVCQCGRCELPRVKKLITSTQYAIRKLRALYARLQ